MRTRILVLAAMVVTAGTFAFMRAKNVSPSDFRDAVFGGAPEFNTDIRTFKDDDKNLPVPQAERVNSLGRASEYETPSSPYTVHPIGNSAVTVDSRTGLMWVTNPDGAGIGGVYNWPDAVKTCAGLKYAGFSDWRLPEIKELAGLVDSKVSGDASTREARRFLDAKPGHYWASTTDQTNAASAWVVLFNSGSMYGYGKTERNYIRCVRKSERSFFRPWFQPAPPGGNNFLRNWL